MIFCTAPWGPLGHLHCVLVTTSDLHWDPGVAGRYENRVMDYCGPPFFWYILLIEAALRQRAGGDQPPSRLSSTQKCGCYWDDGLRGEMDQWETNIRLEPTGLYSFVWRVEMDKSCSSTATVQSMLRTPASCAHVAAGEWAFLWKREMKLSSKSDLFVSSFPWKSEN